MAVVGILAILGFFISLAGLFYSFFKKKPKKKWGIGLVACFILFMIFVATFSPPVKEATAPVSSESKQENHVSTEKSTNSVPTENKLNDTSPNKEKQNVDFDIITRIGHPTLYGSMKTAHQFWEDVTENKIKFGDDYSKLNESTILVLGGYKDDDLIREIVIYFSNFKHPYNANIAEAQQIAMNFMPKDIINEYYTFNKSYRLTSADDAQDSYYVATYYLNKNKKDEARKLNYSGSIDIIIVIDSNNLLKHISIGFGIPKWMNFPDKNGYKVVEWKSDLDFRN